MSESETVPGVKLTWCEVMQGTAFLSLAELREIFRISAADDVLLTRVRALIERGGAFRWDELGDLETYAEWSDPAWSFGTMAATPVARVRRPQAGNPATRNPEAQGSPGGDDNRFTEKEIVEAMTQIRVAPTGLDARHSVTRIVEQIRKNRAYAQERRGQ